MRTPHRVDRINDLEDLLLRGGEENAGAYALACSELTALALTDIANSLRVYLYGAAPPVEAVPDPE